MSPPANGGGSAPAVSLGSSVGATYENGTDVADGAAIDTQIQQYGTNILAGSDIGLGDRVVAAQPRRVDGRDGRGRPPAAAAAPARVAPPPPPRRGRRRRRRRRRAPLTLVMQNIKPIDYGGNSEDVFVNVTCPEGFFGVARAICPETNASVGTNCTGRYWNEGTQTFDYIVAHAAFVLDQGDAELPALERRAPELRRRGVQAAQLDGDQHDVRVRGRGARDGRRELHVGHDGAARPVRGDVRPVGLRARAVHEQPAAADARFGVLAGITLFNGLLGCKHDSRDAAEAWTTVETAKARRAEGREDELGELREVAGVAETAETKAAIAAEHTVAHYARARACPSS